MDIRRGDPLTMAPLSGKMTQIRSLCLLIFSNSCHYHSFRVDQERQKRGFQALGIARRCVILLVSLQEVRIVSLKPKHKKIRNLDVTYELLRAFFCFCYFRVLYLSHFLYLWIVQHAFHICIHHIRVALEVDQKIEHPYLILVPYSCLVHTNWKQH